MLDQSVNIIFVTIIHFKLHIFMTNYQNTEEKSHTKQLEQTTLISWNKKEKQRDYDNEIESKSKIVKFFRQLKDEVVELFSSPEEHDLIQLLTPEEMWNWYSQEKGVLWEKNMIYQLLVETNNISAQLTLNKYFIDNPKGFRQRYFHMLLEEYRRRQV